MRRLAAYILSCLPLFSAAQTLNYTLRDCINRGLENNLEIQITRNSEAIARNNATLANAGALPTVDASAGVRTTLTNLDRTVQRTTDNVTCNTNYADHTFDAGVSLGWTVFDGFRIQTNYRQLKTLSSMGETATRMAIEDLIADITSQYYGYIQQAIRSNYYRYAMSLSKERMRIAEINYRTGRFSGLEYHQAESDFRSDSTSFVRQQEVLVANNIQMNKLMGNVNVNQHLDIPDSSIVINSELNYDDLWQWTLEANTSLLMASYNTTIAQQDYQKVLSRNYPYLKLSAQYGYTHNNYGINSTRVRDNIGLTGALTVGFNIFDGNRRRERANARLTIENRRLQQQQLELELRARLATLWQSYRNNIDLLDLQRQNLVIAQNNLEIAMDRYKLGNLSGFDMRQVEKNLLDAEERVLQVEYEAKLCEISLLLISGQVTEYLE